MNAVTCLHCLTTIRSRNRHDFNGCKCKTDNLRIYVDGGNNYIRRVSGEDAWWVELPSGEVCGKPLIPNSIPVA